MGAKNIAKIVSGIKKHKNPKVIKIVPRGVRIKFVKYDKRGIVLKK